MTASRRAAGIVLFVLVSITVVGCLRGDDDATRSTLTPGQPILLPNQLVQPAPPEACPYRCTAADVEPAELNKVDLLFVIDNSNSMAQEQAVLADQIQVLVRELIEPSGDEPAVRDLHLGVISGDMGTGGYTIMTCEDPVDGDGGELQSRGLLEGCEESYGAAGCDDESCPWLDYPSPAEVPIWESFGCIATLGTGGCGFEQPFEAAVQALTAQPANEGFLRDDSILAIIFVTDEDDCSAADPSLFDPSRPELGALNIRCPLRDEMLVPVDVYHDVLAGLRGSCHDRLVVAAISGVPIDGSWNPGDPIEALEELNVVDPAFPDSMLPTCETEMGRAYAPVRMAELAYAFGDNGVLESICRSDWTGALSAIRRSIQAKLCPA